MPAKNDINIRAGIVGADDVRKGLKAISAETENFAEKLRNADFTPFNSLANKLQRADFGTGAVNNMQKLGQQTALTRQQALSLTYTFNDVTASLASGISPMTILMQQGGQLTQAFGGLRGTIAAIGPMLLKWSVPLAAVGAAVGAVYMAMKVDEKGNEAAKKIADIGDAANKAKVSTEQLQSVMKALIQSGASSVETVANDAASAIERLRDNVQNAKKSQQELLKDKKEFAKRLSVPGPGEDPFEKVAGLQSGKQYKTVQPPPSGSSGLAQINSDLAKGTDLWSKLNMDVRASNGSMKDMGSIAVEVGRRFNQLTTEAKKLEISSLIDKEYGKLADLVRSGNIEKIRDAFSGKVDSRYKLPESDINQAIRVRNQQNENAYLADRTSLRKDAPLMGVAEASNQSALNDLLKEANNIGLLDQAWRKAAEAKKGYYDIKNGEAGAQEANPWTAALMNAPAKAGNAVAQAGQTGLVTAFDSLAGTLQGAIRAVADLANQAARAAGALSSAAASAKSASKDYSGGSGNSGYASGGYISGPGTATSDSIPAMLSNGEFVMRAAAVRAFGVNFMYAINAGIRPPGFASGGLVAAAQMGMERFAGAGGGDRSLTLVLDGKSFGDFRASGGVVDQLERHVAMRRLSSTTGRSPSRIG